MTMNSSQSKPAPDIVLSPDDICGVCDVKRDEHGDTKHAFNIEGELIPLAPPPKARNTPPKLQGEVSLEAQQILRDPLTGPTLRLVEVLIKKNILDGADLMFIFGGGDVAPDRGPTGD